MEAVIGELIQKARKFLKDNKIDYLLVNSTNEFLVEYNDLESNSRFHLTGFSGSVGDALISQKDILLFVDGRYHTQADSEVDFTLVNVVKLNQGDRFSVLLAEGLAPDSVLGICSKKVSQGQLEVLNSELEKKNIVVKMFDFDPIENIVKPEKLNFKEGCIKEPLPTQEDIPINITGLSTEDKVRRIAKNLKKNEAILITSLEEISYLLNSRDFSKKYSSCSIRHPELVSGGGWHIRFDSSIEKFGMTDEQFGNVKKIFVDKTSINAYDYALIEDKALPLAKNLVKEMKSIKTKQEISHYKKCFERTDKALMATREFIENNDNLSEAQIAKVLEDNFYKFGAKSLSFKSIVAKDKNSALAHYSKNSQDEILKEGSLILIDCGAYYEGGYATDITRVFVKGVPSELQKRVYTVVLKGLLKAFRKKIMQNTTGYSLDKAARKVLDANKPKGFEFSHSLGHGIGINVHEAPPRLAPSPLAKTSFKNNMCFTIEPGLYNSEYFGVRLENSCYLSKVKSKKQKAKDEFVIESFTKMPFELKLIDFELLTSTEKKQLKTFALK